MFSRLIALVLLAVALPFFVISCFLVLSSIGRPVFFKQCRVGRYGASFTIYKFRTMMGTDCPIRNECDFYSRTTVITRILRKLKLDELPQIFNILKGDMAFVGPRPLPPSAVNYFTKDQWRLRCKVMPGLTGLSQVNGCDHQSPRRRAVLDCLYAQNKNTCYDFVILFKTFIHIIKNKTSN